VTAGATTRRSAPRLGLPAWVFVPAGVGAMFVVLPLVAMLTRIEWRQFGTQITSE
jgi:molybdate transport system permease protein